MSSDKKVPESAVPRLSRYYRALLGAGDRGLISSEDLAGLTGFGAPQIRKDLTYFGQFGTPGRGYNVEELKRSLSHILGLDQEWNVLLVGVGNLGAALLGYRGLRRPGFKLVAALDKDPGKIGRRMEGLLVRDIAAAEEVVKRENVRMALITVPAPAAQEVADRLVRAGVRAFLNFAPVRLSVPPDVTVHAIDVAIELERLSFLNTHMKGDPHG